MQLNIAQQKQQISSLLTKTGNKKRCMAYSTDPQHHSGYFTHLHKTDADRSVRSAVCWKLFRRCRRQRVVSEDRSFAPEWPLLMAERRKSQLIYPPPAWTTRMALPANTGKSVEREVDLQLQDLMSLVRGWQPGNVSENRRPPFTLIDGSPVQRKISTFQMRACYLIHSILC